MQIYWSNIKQIIDETSEIKTFLVDRPEEFTWQAGAHTHFAMPGFNAGEKPNRSLVRHMSIATLPSENIIGITTRIKEPCSEYKRLLKNLNVGSSVAFFGTSTNVPLKRADKNIYLLSSGVGIATFRPLVLDYFKNAAHVRHVHSLNIESSKEYLFTELFESAADKKFTAQFVAKRPDYYEQVKNLAADRDGLYYIVGSDEFLKQTIAVLREQGIRPEQLVLDKHEPQLPEFLSFD